MSQPTPVTIARGDGIGPEIMDATLRVLTAAGANIATEEVAIGESVYRQGVAEGIEPQAWESLRRTQVFLKAPITTPQGGGYKSLNVTVRKSLGLYANVRPCVAYAPFVQTRHPKMDVVIVRENEEDLYSGIEHRQTQDVYQCLKLISRPGCERIIRYAFEYARANNRRTVTAFVKDNIMKMTDGIFHQVFNEIAQEYPEIAASHMIVDIGAARLADTPEMFDVIVTENLYGDIVSDIAAQITGSVGLAGSANIGRQCAMFEAIHGSAPPLAGRDVANPSGLLLAAVQMLVHIGQPQVAARIHNAWLATLESGLHTPDIYKDSVSHRQVGTREFADTVVARLGQQPETLTPVSYGLQMADDSESAAPAAAPRQEKLRTGCDVFIDWAEGSVDALVAQLSTVQSAGVQLSMIANRGLKVWPDGPPEASQSDHWRLRFISDRGEGEPVSQQQTLALLGRLDALGFDVIKTEGLFHFDGERGYSV